MTPELLTARELSEKYPTSPGCLDTWLRVLEKFRLEGKLAQGQHWFYKSTGNCQPSRGYNERRVLRLCSLKRKEAHCPPFYHQIFQMHPDAERVAASFPQSLVSATSATPEKIDQK